MKARQVSVMALAVGCLIAPGVSLAQASADMPAATSSSPSDAPVQEQKDPLAGDDQEILVTARRTTERLQDVPIAVTSLSGTQLQQRGVTTLTDLNAVTPNMTVKAGNTDPGAAVFVMRGQTQSNVSMTIDTAVGVYQDNVANPRAYGLIGAGLLDVQRIEVLRGPQGTLYGRNTTGGAVSIFTQDPKPEFGASIQLTAGNYETFSGVGILNIPISSSYGLRIVGARGKHGPYFRTEGPRKGLDRPGSDNSEYVRAKLAGESGDLRVSITADYFRNDTGGANSRITGLYDPTLFDTNPANDGTNLGGNAAREAALTLGLNPNVPADLAAARKVLLSYIGRDFYTSYPGDRINSINRGGSVTLGLELSVSDAIKVRSISGYRTFNRLTDDDYDGTPFAIYEGRFISKDTFLSQELQILGDTGPLNWVLGGYFSDEKGLETGNNANNRLFTGSRVLRSGDIESRSYAAFGQANLKLTDRLTVTGGLRYTVEEKTLINKNANSVTGCTVAPAIRDTPSICAATLRATYEAPTWLASVDYKFRPGMLAYGKITRGFKGGGHQNGASGTNLGVYTSFAPEYVTEIEAGLKFQTIDRRLTLNVAVFQDELVDAQRSVAILINGLSAVLVSNAAKARLTGVELEANLRVLPGLTLFGNFGYVNPKYIQFTDLTGDRRGEDWPAADLTYAVGMQASTRTTLGVLTANISYNGQTRQNYSPAAKLRDQVSQPAYGLLNGRITLQSEDHGFELALYANNIAQKKYNVSAVTFESLGVNTLQSGNPRTFGLQLTKRFGGEK